MSNKIPPLLSKSNSYEDWVKKVNIWSRITSLNKVEQGGAILLTLEGDAENAVLELSEDEIVSEDGFTLVKGCLDKLFKKNETLQKFEALDHFETYRRPSDVCINDFIIEFDKRLNRTRKLGTQISDDLLAYRMIKNANLSEQDEKVVKATTTLKYNDVKDKLKSIFGDVGTSTSGGLSDIKSEDVFENDTESTLYTRGKFGNRGFSRGRGRGQLSKRGKTVSYKKSKDGKNPLDPEGNFTQCFTCKSIYHWTPQCPHKTKSTDSDDDHCDQNCSLVTQEIVMLQSHLGNESKIDQLVSETWNSAVLDCGATKTVAGKVWFDNYCDILSDEDKSKIKVENSKSYYRFGDGKRVGSLKNVIIPAVIGKHVVSIDVDIVDENIPLLLSKQSMKNANMKIDFSNDTVNIFNQNMKLCLTESGHYAVPLTIPGQLMQKVESNSKTNFTLKLLHCTNDHEKALKLHAQFAHPTSDKLLKLINSAGKEWANNNNLKKEIKLVTEQCNTCKIFKRPPPRPVVGLPMSSTFNECVAMDIKFFEGKMILHLIDHVTRLSAASRVSSKNPEVVLKSILKNWIVIHGTPLKFLSDNCGEFANEEFINLCEQFNITVKRTAAESPWSNGLVERHNLVIAEMLKKVLHDTDCDFDLGLSWCINAKNSLENVQGYSPFQLSSGQNPRLPAVLSNRPPAYDSSFCSKLIRDNLNALHRAREAFIESERSERISRALSHNIRTSNGTKFVCGDVVYYKRDKIRQWKGPGVVIGQDGQQVLVKHGSTYVRVHPCRLILKGTDSQLSQTNLSNSSLVTHKDINKECQSRTSSNLSLASDDDNDISVIDDDENVSNETEENQQTSSNIDSRLDSDTVPNEHSLQRKLIKDSFIKVRLQGEDDWKKVKLVNRAGKAKGIYKNSWNTENVDTGEANYFDLDRVEWEFDTPSSIEENQASEVTQDCLFSTVYTAEEFKLNDKEATFEDCLFSNGLTSEGLNKILLSEECFYNNILKSTCEDTVLDAKLKEIESWRTNNVFEEVPNCGQKTMSVRWVISPKIVEGKMSTKARLCARGFEETVLNRTDSPTCSREGMRIALSLISSYHWTLNSIDIKTAFLQGNAIDRNVYLKPPCEVKTNKLWKLKKCVYGLSDAPRKCFLKLKFELEKLDAVMCKFDSGLFYFHKNNKLEGVISCHVDDILWGGTDDFRENVIHKLHNVLQIGSENSKAFNYVGMEVSQDEDKSIIVRQDNYIRNMVPIKLTPTQLANTDKTLMETERSQLRSIIGQLNWIACITRPDISFDVSQASSNVKNATIRDIVSINKIVKRVKNKDSFIKFSPLDLKSIHLKSFSDSSFNNLIDGASQGGHILFVCDDQDNCCPIEWRSNRVKRVVRSILAAETLACADCIESDIYISHMITEILGLDSPIDIMTLTDSKSLYDNVNNNKLVNSKLLRVDMRVIQENVEKNNIQLRWTRKENNLSDPLVKNSASPNALLETLKSGKLF